GSPAARGALKKLYRPGLDERDAAAVCVHALYDAADEDAATGGPDRSRRIYPSIAVATDDGFRALSAEQVGEIVEEVVRARYERPDGPVAPIR
ncbi:MAG: proteasome subunit beta, partial [Actinomadura rubrobrunea]|nr:proteasome subunit beta [Actinomadura rubrobrunea]